MRAIPSIHHGAVPLDPGAAATNFDPPPPAWPRVFVINLTRSPERWAAIRAQLEPLGIPFERFDATDGRLLTAEERDRYYSTSLNRRTYHHPLSLGEIACYLSHLRACARILELGLEHAVILEDDIVLDPGFKPALALLAQLPRPWDVVKLGAVSPKPILKYQPLAGFALCHYSKTPISGFAQAISSEGARKILRAREQFGRPYDVDLQHVWENGLKIAGLEPFPVRIRDGILSDIEGCGAIPLHRNIRPIRSLLGRLNFVARQFRHNLALYGLRPLLASRFGRLTRPLGHCRQPLPEAAGQRALITAR